jgi:hypothetical protein
MQEAMRDLHCQILQEMRDLSTTEAASRYLRISHGLVVAFVRVIPLLFRKRNLKIGLLVKR